MTDPDLVAAGDILCEKLARSHYENFTVGSWFLPKDMRRDFLAVYAFCRTTDDIGDESEGDRLKALDAWERSVRNCWGGEVTEPMLAALARTVSERELRQEPFLHLIEANRMDQRQSRWETWDALRHYCAYSANPVGHMVLGLFGADDAERGKLSDSICTGLQLANHWQDVGRDAAEKGRIYLPLEDLKRFEVAEADIVARRPSPAFTEMMKFQVARARKLFDEGEPLVNLVDGTLKRDIKLFLGGGRAILDAIEKQGFDSLTTRLRVSKSTKVWLAMKALVG
ncbi:MAG: squalene synthase HpnC [Planctomycetes bacterium]|nr:squalene synthase HpnC [Planctomycetota bacterium]